MLSRAGVPYVSVSFEESLRKNRRRFNASRPDRILEHSLPEKLEKLYSHDDDVTTPRGKALGVRLEETLQRLRELRWGWSGDCLPEACCVARSEEICVLLLSKPIEERLCFLEVRGIESLAEPGVDAGQELSSLVGLVLFLEQPA